MNNKNEWFFLLVCIGLGVLAEVSFFEETIGISGSIFIAVFYSIFFYRFRQGPFFHKQISGFLFLCIWILTITFAIYSNPLFYSANILLIPLLIFVHTVLFTSSPGTKWHTQAFYSLLRKKAEQFFACFRITFKFISRKLKRKVDSSTLQTAKKTAIGAGLSIPLLFIITTLLSWADENFAHLLMSIPEKMLLFQIEYFWKFVLVSILTIVFFGFMKIVGKKTRLGNGRVVIRKKWDSVIVTTILLFMNIIYALFIMIQFQYFFSGNLHDGFSYAEYARRGFFELLAVTLINYIILIGAISYVKKDKAPIVKGFLTLLIIFSTILLSSAFLRLMLYEQAYGFTYLRVFAHAIMIYLFVVFSFTLWKVWSNRLSLVRLYLLFSLLFYVALNFVGIDQFIVTKNLERYEFTGKLDVDYLSSMSYSVIPPLVELYEKNPNVYGLKSMLMEKKRIINNEKSAWQSYNLSREKAKEALNRVDF